ncbi:hypothetical protein I3842_07G144400 [Carya illinoinensis]|uniref:Uncharacterized protein n=1 Tax=Carya illinoinensis TaxID=32201 RepID=A0A922EML6_CARIL|nr:hypothetical protein I3842_07G144400 [Carya illinoinensis]
MLLALGIIWLLGLNGLRSVLGFGFVNSSGLTAGLSPKKSAILELALDMYQRVEKYKPNFLISNDTTSHYFTLLFFS